MSDPVDPKEICFRVRRVGLGSIGIGLLLLVVTSGAPNIAAALPLLFGAVGNLLFGVRLLFCKVCRNGDRYRVVNPMRVLEIDVAAVVRVSERGPVGMRGLPWVCLDLADGRRVVLAALPGTLDTIEAKRFVRDFTTWGRRNRRDDGHRLMASSKHAGPGSVSSPSRRTLLVSWAVSGFIAILVAASVSGLLGGLLYWVVTCAVLVLLLRTRNTS